MSEATLRIGARTSRLARAQANHVIASLPDESTEFVGIQTSGDLRLDVALGEIGGTGVFTREIERALLDGRIDAAVHSLKDLATVQPEGLTLGAVLEREDPRDVLVLSPDLRARGAETGDPLDSLPPGATVGTSSLRRRAFLLRLRPDLRIEPIRGNVPTRLAKLTAGPLDAIMLAAAGLRRLGMADEIDRYLPTAEFPPAPAQGAVAVQVRLDDERTRDAVAVLDHVPTSIAVAAERSFLNRIEGGCQVPAGALARLDSDTLTLATLVCSPDGARVVAASAAGSIEDAVAVGLAAADRALRDGASEILAVLRNGSEARA